MLDWIESTLRLTTPILFAAMGGLYCERAGIATICLEGAMLAGAWCAAAVTFWTGNAWLGLAAGLAGGALALAVHALLTLRFKAEPILSGVAVNLMVAGVTPLLSKTFFHSPTSTPSIPLEVRFPELGFLVVVFAIPFLTQTFLFRTGLGLRLLAAGDGPDALETSGVKTKFVRLYAMLAGGMLCGLGGVYLATVHASQFTRDMTAGRGFIALAALIFGKWLPIPTLLGCILFGFADALQIQWQSRPIFGVEFPVQVLQALPYLVTLVVLAGFIGKARPPRAISQ